MSAAFEPTQPMVQEPLRLQNPQRRTWEVLLSNTSLLCLAMLGMTVWAMAIGPSWTATNNDALVKLGGNYPQGTLDTGGKWRLLAAKLQTGSWLAAALFLPFFWFVSRGFEQTFGQTLHLGMFLATSALCSCATLVVLHDEKLVSIGAGGPAVAFAACVGVAMLRRSPGAPSWRNWSLWSLIALPYLVLIGFDIARGSADLASLLCGLLVGVVAGLYLPTVEQPVRMREMLVLGAGVAAVLGLVAAALALAPRPPYDLSESLAFKKTVKAYTTVIDGLNRKYEALVAQAVSQELTREQLAASMEADILPAWRAANEHWVATGSIRRYRVPTKRQP
ncbi:MAG: rhomboid family intramembrane serine protease [Pseudomonadota bacterium]